MLEEAAALPEEAAVLAEEAAALPEWVVVASELAGLEGALPFATFALGFFFASAFAVWVTALLLASFVPAAL